MSHRLLICAALARGESLVRRVGTSQDVLATMDCLRALGASLHREGADVRVTGCDPRTAAPACFACRESGSTLRFLIPLCLLSGAEMRLEGSEALMRRPLSVYAELCLAQDLRFEAEVSALTVAGRLASGEYVLPGDVSSQFVSGLLFALPLLDGDSVIRLLPPVESRAYVEMTLRTLGDFGVDVRREDALTLRVPGGSAYAAREASVEGDYSSAAFFTALNALGGAVRITGLNPESLHGDRVCAEYLSRLGRGIPALDVSDCPDLAPVLMAVAAARGGARLTGTRRLRFKESDRGVVMAAELAKFGASVAVGENDILVRPGVLRAPETPLSSHNDHRVAMALSVLCTLTGGEIRGAEAVRKSLPDYWSLLRSLGVGVELLEENKNEAISMN